MTPAELADLLERETATEIERLRRIIGEGIEAFRLTREYLDGGKGDHLLPAAPGWSWFDWTQKAAAAYAAASSDSGEAPDVPAAPIPPEDPTNDR